MNHAFVMLIRREFWENKSLWIAPLAVIGLVVGGAMFAPIREGRGQGFSVSPPTVAEASQAVGAVSLTGIMALLAAVAGFVGTYLAAALSASRAAS